MDALDYNVTVGRHFPGSIRLVEEDVFPAMHQTP